MVSAQQKPVVVLGAGDIAPVIEQYRKLLSEPLRGWKLAAAALVMTGLCLNVLWPRFAAIRGARTPPAA